MKLKDQLGDKSKLYIWILTILGALYGIATGGVIGMLAGALVGFYLSGILFLFALAMLKWLFVAGHLWLKFFGGFFLGSWLYVLVILILPLASPFLLLVTIPIGYLITLNHDRLFFKKGKIANAAINSDIEGIPPTYEEISGQ